MAEDDEGGIGGSHSISILGAQRCAKAGDAEVDDAETITPLSRLAADEHIIALLEASAAKGWKLWRLTESGRRK